MFAALFSALPFYFDVLRLIIPTSKIITCLMENICQGRLVTIRLMAKLSGPINRCHWDGCPGNVPLIFLPRTDWWFCVASLM